MIVGTLAKVSTLFRFVGMFQRPPAASESRGGRGLGMPRSPSMEATSAVDSPQTNAPAPSLISMSKSSPQPRMFLPRSPSASCLFDRDAEVLHGERILVPHVDVTVLRADGIGVDDHAFDDGMGVALHERSGP